MSHGIGDAELTRAIDMIKHLSEGIGPRPPCSRAEKRAAQDIAGELEKLGLAVTTESFESTQSFGPAYLLTFGAALAAAYVERRSRVTGALLGISAALVGILESRFSRLSPTRFLRTDDSRNVWATLEPAGSAERTVCLVSHMDSSRSGLMFHPSVTPHLGNAAAAVSLGLVGQAFAPLLRKVPGGAPVLGIARLLVAAGAVLVLERELRGQDVPGANDNASSVGACIGLAGHFTLEPLGRTRLVILVTGSEESGVFGMRDFLARHKTEGWLFLNFDGVGADAPLRVLAREGGPLSTLKADPDLMNAAASISAEWPDLAAEPLKDGSGLPYDATPVIRAGGRAITIVNQEGAIPNYHWPTDTADRISYPALKKAMAFGAAMVRRLDRG